MSSQAKLREIIDDRTLRVAAADANIRLLNDRLGAVTQRNIQLRGEMHQLQLKITQTRTRVNKYRVKSDIMDHSRDKGYVAKKVFNFLWYYVTFASVAAAGIPPIHTTVRMWVETEQIVIESVGLVAYLGASLRTTSGFSMTDCGSSGDTNFTNICLGGVIIRWIFYLGKYRDAYAECLSLRSYRP